MSIRARLPVVCGRAAVVAVIVGTLLNLINQGDALLSGGEVSVLKIVLTYLVPFVVSTHGALMAHR
ncbi:MAG: nitrate/nitrite transporter NrtS [Amphiplicatus sp.]